MNSIINVLLGAEFHRVGPSGR